MCGPVALALPVHGRHGISQFKRISFILLYNGGRIISYSFTGLIFGLLGRGFALAGWQDTLSISLGVLILILIFVPKLSIVKNNSASLAYLFIEKLKSSLRRFIGSGNASSMLLVGILNGFLPCGLVYLGITGSVATTDALHGALFMAAFGLGTFPAMLAVSLAKKFITLHSRQTIRKLIPVFASVMAALLIIRGLDLSIPYLSPSLHFSSGTGIVPECGH
jgi:sulfite exporter TauE/SafE